MPEYLNLQIFLLTMTQTDVSYQKLTGEWNKHIRKRKGLKKLYNKKRRAFLKKMFNKLEI